MLTCSLVCRDLSCPLTHFMKKWFPIAATKAELSSSSVVLLLDGPLPAKKTLSWSAKKSRIYHREQSHLSTNLLLKSMHIIPSAYFRPSTPNGKLLIVNYPLCKILYWRWEGVEYRQLRYSRTSQHLTTEWSFYLLSNSNETKRHRPQKTCYFDPTWNFLWFNFHSGNCKRIW